VRFRVPLCLMLTVLAVSLAFSQTNQNAADSISPMRRLYVQDQRDRGVLLSDSGESLPRTADTKGAAQIDDATREKRDSERRQRVRELLSEGKVTTAQDFHDAAYIFQHGQEAQDYLLAHVLAVEAVVKRDSSSKWISAATLDRYLQAIGQAQVFGTQYSDRDSAFMMAHRGDQEAIKAHKHEPGMSMQPYDDRLMPDALRRDFCVPSRAQQEINLKEFEAGGYPEGILPPGCTR
jgi:hypothetical protein